MVYVLLGITDFYTTKWKAEVLKNDPQTLGDDTTWSRIDMGMKIRRKNCTSVVSSVRFFQPRQMRLPYDVSMFTACGWFFVSVEHITGHRQKNKNPGGNPSFENKLDIEIVKFL